MQSDTPAAPFPPSIYQNAESFFIPLKLHIIIKQPNLLARLKSRHTNIRTPITAEGITKTTISTRPDLSLDREIDFREILSAEFEGLELGVCRGAFGRVFGGDFLG